MPAQARLLTRLLFFLQFKRARIPVVDLLLEAGAHLALDLLDLGQAARLDLGHMRLRQLDSGEPHGRLFQLSRQPVLMEDVLHARDLLRSGRAQVEVRRDTGVDGLPRLVDRGELKLLRHHMRLARAGRQAILNAVLKKEDRRQVSPSIKVVDQDRALTHDLLILLAHDADHRFEQRMTRAHECRDRLLVDPALFETDALILLLDRRAGADLAIPLADPDRDVSDLPTPLFPALHLAAQMLESFNEEALDMVRLQPLSLGALHLQAQLLDLGLGHGVVRQSTPLEQLKQVPLIDRAIDLAE